MSDTSAIDEILSEFQQLATDLTNNASGDIQKAFDALGNSSLYKYDAYKYQIPSAPIIGPITFPVGPQRPGAPGLPEEPTLIEIGMDIPSPSFGSAPVNSISVPIISFPSQPPDAPPDLTGSAPVVNTPVFPTKPGLLALPSSALPYPTVSVPSAPVFTPPVFDGTPPADIVTLTLDEYLDKLTSSYANYSQLIPQLVQDHWMIWFRGMIDENPNIRKLDGIIGTYLDVGGSGIPTPIEEAIVTRATDRVYAESLRERAAVWDSMAQRGLTLPSGALMSGLKEARAKFAEQVVKVGTDVAIKNLELEHDHMKFMLQLGVELQKMLLSFAGDTAKTVAELNNQAIEITKLLLTGMIEINNSMIKVYLAKWEGYKAAVEVFRAKWMGIETQIRAYEAQIRAELAKTEVNKAVVEVLRTLVGANEALVQMYKTQVDAETAKIEADRVRVMAYEAVVRAYTAKVEGYKARWQGYAAAVEGQKAVAGVYESQVRGYVANVEGYKAGVEAYGAQVRGFSAEVEAISRQNETALKAWSIKLDGLLKAYGEDVKAYGANWSALGEQMRATANVLGIQSEFLTKMYNVALQIEIERAREHFTTWRAQLEAGLRAGEGLAHAAGVAGQLANSVLSGFTTFAGNLTSTVGLS